MAELLQDLLTWVAANPGWAHLVVFLVALAESLAIVGLIVPGAVMLLGAGALIATGSLAFWPVCLWAIAGAVVGDGLSFWVGRRYQDRLKATWPFTRYPETLDAGIGFFQRYGGKSVAFGRFVGPVRAVIPLVAGMLGMQSGRFLFANVLSAIVWAPAYLLPGIVFGASLELAAEATFHLVLLLLALVGLIWAVAWGVRQLFLLYSPRAKGWVEQLLRWAEVHPRMGDVARSLADPDHPEAGTLAVLAGILLLTAALSALIAAFAVAGAAQLPLNQMVLDLGLSLQTPAASYLMTALSRLGDLAVILPVVLVVSGWLYWRGERRHAGYWLAAGGFGVAAGSFVGALLQPPMLDTGAPVPFSGALTSGHTLRATAVYGFLAVSLAGGITPTWRWLPYVWAAVLITAVAVSRLYFGASWLTDVLGGLTLGLAWVAALGLAYRRHRHTETSWRKLAATFLAILAVSFGLQSAVSRSSDLTRYHRAAEVIGITESEWRKTIWHTLPQTRDDLRKAYRHPLNLQYAGSLDVLRAKLAAMGWEPATKLSWKSAMKLLSPSLALDELPVIPHVHDGRYESLALVKQAPDEGRLVLRLWTIPYRVGGKTPLWIGNVTAQHKRVILGLLAIPATDPDTHHPMESVQGDFSALHPYRPDADAPLLLKEAPKSPTTQNAEGARDP